MTVADERDRLLAALTARPELDDWSVQVITTEATWRGDGDEPTAGSRIQTALWATVHRDLPAGRGSASVRLDPTRDLTVALAEATARAEAAVGAPWQTPPPAAPARVELLDPTLGAPDAALDAIGARLDAGRGDHRVISVETSLELAELELYTRRGQRARWRTSALAVAATLDDAGRRFAITAAARRVDELGLDAAIAQAAPGRDRPPLAEGSYPIALTAAALTHGARGLLEAFVAQADPRLARQGLVRYRPGQAVAEGAHLGLASDGTLPFGWLSAPLGATGEAIRRFALVTDGVAAGLGLDAREAALRGELPNGGVRGLVVDAGADDDAALVTDDTLVIERLRWLELDAMTGWFRAAFDRARRGRDPQAVVGGGVLRGDAIALLGRARRGRTLTATPWYRGPALWHLGSVALD